MKPEELIESLEFVGDDLLADTERTIQVRKNRWGGRNTASSAKEESTMKVEKSRAWIGAAVAAVLVLAMGFGGFSLWQHLKPDRSSASSGPVVVMPSPTASDAEEPEPVNDGPIILAPIRIGDNWTGVSVRSFDDIERAMQANPWKEGSYDTLPVFRNLAYREEEQLCRYYTDKELGELVLDAAQRFGVTLPLKDIEFNMPEKSEADAANEKGLDPDKPAFAMVGTDKGTLIVEGDGSVHFFFDETHRITAEPSYYTVEGPEGLTEEDRDYAMHTGVVRSWMEQLQPILQMPDYGIASHPRYENYLSSWDVWTVYPLRSRPWDQLLSYNFEQVMLLTLDGVTLEGIVITQWPPEGGFQRLDGFESSVPWLESLGGYPLISPEQARTYLLNGDFLTEADRAAFSSDLKTVTGTPDELSDLFGFEVTLDGNGMSANSEDGSDMMFSGSFEFSSGQDGTVAIRVGGSVASCMELVYLTETSHSLLIPFYRFWVPADGSGDSGRYLAAYVPAISMCSDFPPVSIEPDETEPDPETTEIPDGTERPEESGPATEVPETTLPEPTAVADPMDLPDLPVLSLESGFRCGYGEEIATLEDVEANLAVSPWRKDPGRPITALTVFRNLAYHDKEGVARYYDEQTLRSRIENLAAALHLSILRTDPESKTVERDGKTVTLPAQLTARTDLGTIVITGDGQTAICFDEPQSIDRFVSLHTGPGEHVDLPEYSDESAFDFAQAWIAYLLNLDGRLIRRSDEHSFFELRPSSFEDPGREGAEPSEGDPNAKTHKPRSFRWWAHNLDEEAPLQYTFGGTITLDGNGMLTVFTIDADAREEIGDYPIISPEEADEMLREGRYLSTAWLELLPDGCLGGQNLLNRSVRRELVYRTSKIEEIFLPFYRYWIPLEGAEPQAGAASYGALYVPAVREEYLTEWPSEWTPAELNAYRSTLAELRDWFSGPERQALLCTDAQSELILDSWIHGAEDDVIELRYWCGRDKMIPWSANLRRTEEGWEVLSKSPSTWNQVP